MTVNYFAVVTKAMMMMQYATGCDALASAGVEIDDEIRVARLRYYLAELAGLLGMKLVAK